jgi:hypothetical protein
MTRTTLATTGSVKVSAEGPGSTTRDSRLSAPRGPDRPARLDHEWEPPYVVPDLLHVGEPAAGPATGPAPGSARVRYLAAHGTPATIDELQDHTVVSTWTRCCSDLVDWSLSGSTEDRRGAPAQNLRKSICRLK